MYRAFTFVLVAALAAFVLAAPTPRQVEGKSFKFSVRPRARGRPRDEMARAYRKFRWHMIEFPDGLAGIFGGDDSGSETTGEGASSTGTGGGNLWPFPSLFPGFPGSSASAAAPYPAPTSASAAPAASASYSSSAGQPSSGAVTDGEVVAKPSEGDSEYNSPVTIGGQTLDLDFDTGSSDLWVFSSSLPSSEIKGHRVFDPSNSKSFTPYEGASFQLQYGDGSQASGTVGFDTVTIGGATVTKQAVEVATSISGNFLSSDNSDGLVGLGFSSINQVQPQPQKTFFENVSPSLGQAVLTADLGTNSGTYEFGTIDSSKYSGDIHYTPINSDEGYWLFDSPSYSIDGKQSACSTCSPAIADTGTSLLLVDNDVAEAYYDQVPSASMDYQQGGYTFDCSATMPSFGVAIGDYTATIPGSAMSYQDLGDGSCFGGVQSAGMTGGAGPTMQIYGDFFLKHVFAVFDNGNNGPRFGVANKD